MSGDGEAFGGFDLGVACVYFGFGGGDELVEEVIGFDAEADRQRYFVTESGITVVTRDYSLFENPVTVDYFTSE